MFLLYVATFFVALFSSMLSGMAGGGGGFIVVPYWLIIGMTPAQGATTGGFMAIGMGASSLAAFKGTSHMPNDKRLQYILLAITTCAAIIGALVLPHVHTASFKTALGVVTIVSLPLLFIKVRSLHVHVHSRKLGIALIGLLLFVSSVITSSAFSILIAVCISAFFDMSILQTTALRRMIGIVQSVLIFIVLVLHGNFVWPHAVIGLLGGSLGSYLGTRFAIKRGETFAKYALAAGALAGAIALLV